jgi:predicted phosphoribosyltransferase
VKACFANRDEAGRQLAEQLARFELEKPIILALVRGGVPVAAPIADALGAPLEIALVRKIGAPLQPELAIGAVVDGAHSYLHRDEGLIYTLHVPESHIQRVLEHELAEIERRRAFYLAGREPASLRGRLVIIVDDGVATGASVRAVVAACRAAGAARIVLATPVIAYSTKARLTGTVDEIVCLIAPQDFGAVGEFYRDFSEVTDDAVVRLLGGRAAPG